MSDAQHTNLLLTIARIVCANVGPGQQEHILEAVKDWPHAKQFIGKPTEARRSRRNTEPSQDHDHEVANGDQ